ncbi:uncharacterized protein BDZ99DRAFT_519901 [Mytilinidion resinicola]|uniref:Heterokaryon incompatibility domain-containing protein n=1 Tax=Mytilinidion resinicola TaxID=574789 RepID=A0A6A6YQR1_9PEZI|nr:uncharacterized protein BDZ99DRAFT_519901 [Mytilinidion resinicola]KAF2811246.1 hypothetical protein BDZ99DRAFT_519901 [Mytilinidion resinicola]
MQRDTALTFGDIHGSLEALQASIDEIQEVALVEEAQLHIESAPINLRFLVPHGTPSFDADGSVKRVAVSYTWDHDNSQDKNKSFPDYVIWAGGVFRPPRCHVEIIHRAFCFARSKEASLGGSPRVWIDQECIDQTDPADIERHLRIMHRVYSQSTFTAAILSTKISSQSFLDNLEEFFVTDTKEF